MNRREATSTVRDGLRVDYRCVRSVVLDGEKFSQVRGLRRYVA